MARPVIYRPSTIELLGAPGHFLYELKMFFVATDILEDPAVQNNPQLKFAILESALIHARNLLDFFCGKESREDNLIAGHFIRNSDDTPWISSKLTFLSSCKADINKALSHLTYSRVKSQPAWQMATIKQEIEDAYVEFTALLPVSVRSKWVF